MSFFRHGKKTLQSTLFANGRRIGVAVAAGILLLKDSFEFEKFSPKFLSLTNPSSSFDQIFADITLHEFKHLVELFANPEINVETEKIIILKNPQFYNDNFLRELQQTLFQLQQANPDLKILALDEEELTTEQKHQLVQILRGKFNPEKSYDGNDDFPELKGQNTLFYCKNQYDDKFEDLPFSTYFNNKEYLNHYFQSLKTLTAQNDAKLFEFVGSRMGPDQLYFVAVLPTSGEEALDSKTLRLAQKRLNDLKINTFMNDGQKYGVVYADQTKLSFGDFEPGDIFMV